VLGWVLGANALNGAFYSLTFGGSIFMLFMDHLGLSKARIGLVQSLFPFCGLLALVVGPWTARVGFKKSFLILYAVRKPVLLGLLLAPTVAARMGASAGGWYVAGVILVFAVCRAIAETGYYPWYRDFIPDAVRGRFSAVSQATTVATCAATIWIASHVLEHSRGAGGYMSLIAVGVGLGLVSVALMVPVPGGTRSVVPTSMAHYLGGIRACLADRRFVWFLLGVGCYVMGAAIVPFITLFMRDLVGLSQATVVRLEPAAMVGGVFSGLVAGYAADRRGGRRVTMVGAAGACLLPVLWMLIPPHSAASAPLAFAGACWWGMCSAAVGIGTTRLLFSELIPPPRSMNYSTVNYAATGLFCGIGPLVIGHALTALKGLDQRVLGLHVNQYTPLLAVSLILILASGLCFARTGRGGSGASRVA
jgi:MFS family permease